MIRKLKIEISDALQRILQQLFGLEQYEIPEAQFPDPAMGDLSYTLCFPLAKILRKSPKQIADQIVGAFPATHFPLIDMVEVGGGGYLNFRLNRESIATQLFAHPLQPDAPRKEKAIVEHTSINPNKAAHVGHLRNACLGDSLMRLLRFRGTQVDIQNYIDDTGVQVADVVFGFQQLGKGVDDLKNIPGKLDNYFWDLYAKTHQEIEDSPEAKTKRDAILKDMEHREEPTFSLSQGIADAMIRCHLATMRKLDIEYELLIRESDIIGLRFWERTFELLKQKGAIVKVEEGKTKGCWVMRLQGSEGFEDMQNADKVIVRSNGVVTYVGKDIAYQLWKFGLLGVDFSFREFARLSDDRILWSTTTTDGDPKAPHFGGSDIVYNVIDQRQSYLQKVVAEGLRALGYEKQAENSIHFAYEMVALSPKTAQTLGLSLTEEDQKRSFVEMSGRKGLGVKADDLMIHLEKTLVERIASQYSDLSAEEIPRLAATIATGALRYFMVRFARNTLITFDIDEASSFEGETGPYLQYSAVRARSILRKLTDTGFDLAANREALMAALRGLTQKDPEADDSWSILYKIAQTHDIVEKAIITLEVSFFARHAFELARAFNNYYHKYPILQETDEQRKRQRIAVVQMFVTGFETILRLLGISIPARM